MNWSGWLMEPFEYDFMVRAAVATIAVCIAAPACGVWALSRRLVYLTDAMSHGMLAGVAGAAIIGGSLLVGGLIAALAMALFISLLVVRARVPEDGAIGVVGQGLFALGVIGVSLQSEPRALAHVLFGNPLTVSRFDVIVDVALVHARTVGMRVGLIDSALLVVLSMTVVAGLVTVGVLMAVTLIVAPAVTARMLGRSLNAMFAIAVASGLMAGVVGLLVSYHAGLPTGPTVALLAVAQVGVAALWAHPARASRRSLIPDRASAAAH